MNNKSLTRDNLAKRQHLEDLTCVFCCEPESLQHLFFDCVVARQVWLVIADCTKMPIPDSFESFLPFWKKKKNAMMQLTWSLLLPYGAYGCFGMNLCFRGENGEVSNVYWEWWGGISINGRSCAWTPKLCYSSNA